MMTDVCDLCGAIENMIRTADPARRRAVARAFDGYAATFPGNYEWAVSGQAPALLHFLMGAIEMTCQQPSKPKPDFLAPSPAYPGGRIRYSNLFSLLSLWGSA
jgi:hypothetical protein